MFLKINIVLLSFIIVLPFLANNINPTKSNIDSLNKLAWQNAENITLSAFEKAIWCRTNSLKIDYEDGVAISSINLGLISLLTGDIEKSLEYTLDAINRTKIDSVKAIAYNQIGRIYIELAEFEKSKKSLFKAIHLNEASNNLISLQGNFINYGNLKEQIFEIDSANFYYNKALTISKDLNYSEGIVSALNNIGSLNGLLNNFDEEQKQYLEALSYAKPNSIQSSQIHFNLSISFFTIGKNEKAINHAQNALTIAQSNNFTKGMQKAYEMLSILSEMEGNYKVGLEYQKKYNELSQELINETTLKKITQIQLENDFGQQQKLDSIAKAKEISKINEENQRKEIIRTQEARQRNIILVFISIILIAAIIIAVRFFKIGKERQKTNEIISQQKVEVEKQRDIAQKEHAIAEEQKTIVEHKNQEIIESITYAKRLQEAILPPPKLVKEWLTESFILYKPKDIVAGDFYWMETADQEIDGILKTLIYFAAADCTGHGVPGALVSVVCANAMNRSIKEFNLKQPGEILDKVTELVIESFEKGEEIIKDGMDIALCSLDVTNRKLNFGGANNPLWIVSNSPAIETNGIFKTMEDGEGKFLHEVRATKQPVGLFVTRKNFENIEVQLSPGDEIFISSDGFPDQFGGKDGKKYKSLNFKKYLMSIANFPIQEQKELLYQEFENWRGDLEQIDDVCVIGVKLNDSDSDLFTKRELEVLSLVKEGLSSKMIADKMNISKHTVDTYRRRLLSKSGTHNAAELIKYGEKNSLI